MILPYTKGYLSDEKTILMDSKRYFPLFFFLFNEVSTNPQGRQQLQMLPALWISKWQWNGKTPWEKIFPRGFFTTKGKRNFNATQQPPPDPKTDALMPVERKNPLREKFPLGVFQN